MISNFFVEKIICCFREIIEKICCIREYDNQKNRKIRVTAFFAGSGDLFVSISHKNFILR